MAKKTIPCPNPYCVNGWNVMLNRERCSTCNGAGEIEVEDKD